MSMRKISAIVSAAAVAVTGFIVLPMASGDEVTTTASISLTCKATPSTSLAGAQTFSAEDVAVNVTAPTNVDVGDNFSTTFSIDPVSVEVPSLPLGARLEKASRLKLDFALPDGVTFQNAEIDESNANLKGFTVLRVNEAGSPDPNGRILRLTSADNATIGNGPNSSKTSHGGIEYTITGSKIDLRFPVVKLNLKADTAGEKNFGVRTAGAAGNFGTDENFLTMNAQTSSIAFVGRVWAPTQCSPRASESAPIDQRATRLATVTVNPEAAATETSVTLSRPAEAVAGQPTELVATVAPQDAQGTVVFSSGQLSTAPVEVKDGRATGTLTFPEAGNYDVTATFTPANDKNFTASSITENVTVAGQVAEMQLKAPASAPARNKAEVSATLPKGASGTVTFRIGDATEVTADVQAADGVATAPVPTGTATGPQKLTAVYQPSAGSPFAKAQATADITIDAVAGTSLELAGLDGSTRPGDPVTISANVIPAENTDSAAGQVIFTVDGRDFPVQVEGQRAAIEFTPDRAGEFPVTARFVPADATQTPAEATGTLKVVGATETSISAAVPKNIEPLVEAPTTFTVTPAAAGTLVATIDGRKISGAVDAATGTVTLPLVFPREGDYAVPVDFTPADPRAARPASTVVNVSVKAPSYDAVSVALTTNPEGKVGDKHAFRANVTPNTGSASNVSGFVTLTNNGEKVTKDGAEVRISVVRGVAEFDLTWNDAGTKNIVATFVNAEGTSMGSGSATVTVADPNGEVPPTDGGGTDNPGTDNPDVDGDLSSSSSSGSVFSSIISFFEKLWKFIVDLFTGAGSHGSSSLSSGTQSTPNPTI
ncbi:Ig-like domain-containing protein [Corynebacterium falsenii]|uniref:Ig-like domain-containing protein n=1 Tax=Corynebacterium falsenii TaxID=108486 RepID=UPI001CCAD15A|nr:Ig-like domain-containing protein [Corynebacterium falsenii]MDC7103217.1 Ig-like domain-containing protein [Corynebacterium falsenii]UBI04719.1 Ig-like domain-containing protein [Corynebacterium falsenii]